MNNFINRSAVLMSFVLLFILTFTACSSKNTASAVSDPADTGYFGVNYTDTGDTNNSKQSIRHTASQTASPSVLSQISENIGKVNSGSPEKKNDSSKSEASYSASENKKRESTTKTVTTYYFVEEDDESVSSDESESREQTDEGQPDTAEETDSAAFETDSDDETDALTQDDTDNAENTDLSEQVYSGEFTEDDLTITIDGVPVTFGTDITIVESVLGEPLSVDDTISETDPQIVTKKMYNFESLCIDTSLSDDETYYEIVGIQIFDEFIPTDKGLRVGMTGEDAISIYGESMMIYGDYYRYYIDNKYMYLYITNDIVANIGYSIDREVQTDDWTGY